MIPVLNGTRVRLRGFTWADFPAFADMWDDADLTKFIPFAPVSPGMSWGRFNLNNYRWVRDGFGNWAVVDHDDSFLGSTGFFRNPNAGMGAEYDAGIQSGWVFLRAARGHGYASEAVELAHAWFDRQQFGGVSYCGIAAENGASIRIGEKAGYQHFATIDDQSGTSLTMKRVI